MTEADGAGLRARLLAAGGAPLRLRVAEMVSAAVGGIPDADLPASLRRVARFAPAKRARAGQAPLLAALADDAFTDVVAGWWREHRAQEWAAGGGEPAAGPGADPPPGPEPGPMSPPEPAVDGSASGGDPLHRAAVAVLEGRDEGATLARDVAEKAESGRLRAELDAARTRVQRLGADLAVALRERDEARAAVRAVEPDRSDEVTKLRARLREQGVRVRHAEDAAAEARTRLEAGHAGAVAEADGVRRERDRLRGSVSAAEERARRAVAELDTVRRGAREARRADEARLALLLDTVAGAAAGLRAELGLAATHPAGASDPGAGPVRDPGPRPADVVAGPAGVDAADAAGVAPLTPGALERLLGLPEVHVIVDGYNVTKAVWPALTLMEQRERLVAALAPLGRRTGAETTVVFDGAAVVGVPAPTARGVRVLFSEAGQIADDLIRRLVVAEPRGRPLVVVTSDREVVDSVRREGAHPVPSRVFAARLGRV